MASSGHIRNGSDLDDPSEQSSHGQNGATAADGSSNHCSLCGRAENLMRCGRCSMVYYCSKAHQVEDWKKKHKKHCKKAVPASSNPVQVNSQVKSNGEGTFVRPASIPPRSAAGPQKPLPPPGGVKLSTGSPVSETVKSNLTMDLAGSDDSCDYKPRAFPRPPRLDTGSIAAHVFKHLSQDGYCVIDNIQDLEFARNLAREVKALYQSGRFVDGQIGGGKASEVAEGKLVQKNIRGDKIVMLDGNEPTLPYISKVNMFLTNVVNGLNFHLKGRYVISGRTKIMVACYPGNGTGYARHVDNPNRDGRCITCLYYLNEGWDVTKQGGLLRLYPSSSSECVCIEPILNRVCFFWSDRRSPHEVLPAFDSRYAITIWYLDKNERLEARETQRRQAATVGFAMKKLQLATPPEGQETEAKAGQEAESLAEENFEAIARGLQEASSPHDYLTSVGVPEDTQTEAMQRMQENQQEPIS